MGQRRQLYLYWKTRTPEAARPAAAQFQQQLCQRWPGLQAELLARAETTEGPSTLMEIYRHPEGISPAQQADIESAGHAALQAWLAGPRIVEVFVPCPQTAG